MCVCTHAFKLLLTFSCQLRSNAIILSEVYQMEGFSNWIKIERMVSNYFIKNVSEEVWDKDIHAHIHTHAHTHAHTHVHIHVYTNFLDKNNGKVYTGQVSLV